MNSSANAKVTPIRAELPPTDKPRQRRRRWPMAIGLLVLMSAGGYAAYRYLYEPSTIFTVPSTQLEISAVASGPFIEFISLRGHVAPAVTVEIAPEVSGRVEEVVVDPGAIVAAGDPLVRIANPAFELEILSREAQAIEQINSQKSLQIAARARLAEMERTIAATRFRIDQLESEVSRMEALVAGGSHPAALLEASRQELEYQRGLEEILEQQAGTEAIASREIDDSLEQTSEILAEINDRRRAQLEALTIRAPINGYVSGLDIVPGERIAEGQPIGNVDARDSYKVVFLADEFYFTRVAVGQSVIASIDGALFELLVTDMSPRIESGQFRIDANFTEGQAPARMVRGQSISARLVVDETSDALSLPTGAFLESSSGRWVFVVDDRGLARKIPISIGRRTNEKVEVLSGLEEGARVITSGYSEFAHLDIVRVYGEGS